MSALRHLLLAQALSAQQRPPGDLPEFQRLAGLEGELGGVTATGFLVYCSPEVSVHDFLERIAPRLLAQLTRSTLPQRVLLRGRARGSVDWAGTTRARYGGNQDPTLFVCRQSWRLYDRPENQLLKYLLDRLRRCNDRAPAELRHWSASQSGDFRSAPVRDPLAVVAHRLRRFGVNAYLRDVELPATIQDRHLLAARTARNPLYAQMAAFYDFFASVVERPEWEPWVKVLRQSAILLPAHEARSLRRVMAPEPSIPEPASALPKSTSVPASSMG